MEQYLYLSGILLLSFTTIVLLILLILSKRKNLGLEKRLANREEIANESYVRFLNESRNTAYEYIEDVQDKLILQKELSRSSTITTHMARQFRVHTPYSLKNLAKLMKTLKL
jgi:hypothetical protein